MLPVSCPRFVLLLRGPTRLGGDGFFVEGGFLAGPRGSTEREAGGMRAYEECLWRAQREERSRAVGIEAGDLER